MIEAQFRKDTARRYLAYFGNENPTKKQICEMARLLFNVWLKRDVLFSPKLSKRQRQCLYHAAHGKSAKVIARLLGIGVETVEAHSKAILERLSCHNMKQAIAVGIRYGKYGKDNGK